MITLKKSDLNSLIATYLQKNGYDHSYFTFSAEVKIETPTVISLEQLVQMGMQYYYVETHIKDGTFVPCETKMSLTEEHLCTVCNNEETKDLGLLVLPVVETEKEIPKIENSSMKTENTIKKSSPEKKREEMSSKESSIKEEPQNVKRLKSALTYQTIPGNFPEATICAWNNKRLALGCENIAVFNENKQIGVFDMNTEVTSMAWVDENTLSIGTYRGEVHLLDTDKQKIVHTVDAHDGPVFSIKSYKNKILTAGFDGKACIIDDTPHHNLTRFSPHSNPCLDCEWITDSSFITCSTDFNIAMVSNNTTEYLKGHVNTVNAISHRDNIIASSSDDTTVILWNIDTKKNVILNGHTKPVHTHKWGTQYLFSGSNDGALFLWDINRGTAQTQMNVSKKLNVIETMENICIVGTDKGVVFYDQNGTEIRKINTGGVWDVKGNDGKVVICLEDSSAMVIDIRYG